jgi:hypothetical protein
MHWRVSALTAVLASVLALFVTVARADTVSASTVGGQDLPVSVLSASLDRDSGYFTAEVRNSTGEGARILVLAGMIRGESGATGYFARSVPGRIAPMTDATVTVWVGDLNLSWRSARQVAIGVAAVRFESGTTWSEERQVLGALRAEATAQGNEEPRTDSSPGGGLSAIGGWVEPDMGSNCSVMCLDFCGQSCGYRMRRGGCTGTPCVVSCECNMNYNGNTGQCEGSMSATCDTSNPDACC